MGDHSTTTRLHNFSLVVSTLPPLRGDKVWSLASVTYGMDGIIASKGANRPTETRREVVEKKSSSAKLPWLVSSSVFCAVIYFNINCFVSSKTVSSPPSPYPGL